MNPINTKVKFYNAEKRFGFSVEGIYLSFARCKCKLGNRGIFNSRPIEELLHYIKPGTEIIIERVEAGEKGPAAADWIVADQKALALASAKYDKKQEALQKAEAEKKLRETEARLLREAAIEEQFGWIIQRLTPALELVSRRPTALVFYPGHSNFYISCVTGDLPTNEEGVAAAEAKLADLLARIKLVADNKAAMIEQLRLIAITDVEKQLVEKLASVINRYDGRITNGVIMSYDYARTEIESFVSKFDWLSYTACMGDKANQSGVFFRTKNIVVDRVSSEDEMLYQFQSGLNVDRRGE